MNEFLKKWLLLLVILLVALIALIWKQCCTPADPRVAVYETIIAPHAIALIDANGAAARNVQKALVTIIDPDGMVVSSNGYKFESVEILGGVMSIGLSQQAKFSVEKPYRFFIKVEADGYMSNVKTVVVTQDAPNYVPIYMVNLTEAPRSGFGVTAASFAGATGGVVQNTQLLATSLSDIGYVSAFAPLSITIPEGARMLYDGKPVESSSDTLSYRLVLGNPLDSLGSRVFPGGFEVTDAVDANGSPFRLPNDQDISPANPMYFTSASWFSLEMNLGNEKVNGFSSPVKVEMPVMPGVIDPVTGVPVTVGSKIPLWNMDNRTGVWKNEGIGTVEDAGGGQMKVVFETTHFSVWNLDLPGTRCPIGTVIPFAYDNALFSGSKFTRVLNRATGAEVTSRLFDFSAMGGSPLNLGVLPSSAEEMQLVVHNGSDASAPILGVSGNMRNCACVAPPCSLNLVGAPLTCITLKFQVGASVVHPCNNSVWYKNCADPLYTLGGILSTGGELTLAELNSTRCVRLWYIDPTSGNPVTLDFTVNFARAIAGSNYSGPLAVSPSTAMTPPNFEYLVSSSPGCVKSITIFVPTVGIPSLAWCN